MSEGLVDVHTTLCYTSGRASFSFQFPLCSILFCPLENSVLFSYSSCPIISTLCPIFHIFRLSFFHILLFSCFHSLCFLRVLWLCLILLPPCTRVPHYFHIPTFCLNLFSLSISSFCFPLYLRYTSVNHCTHDLSFCIDIVATNTTQIYGSSNFYCSSTA